MLALGIESESEEVRKDMTKRLERQKIQTAFQNMREAGVKSFAFFIFGYPGETVADDGGDDALRHRARSRLRQLLPRGALPGHRAVREVRARRLAEGRGCRLDEDGVLGTTCCTATASTSGSSWTRSTAPSAASSCARRYITRHLGDVARLALTKQNIVWQVLSRTILGARTVDTTVAPTAVSSRRRPDATVTRARRPRCADGAD